MRLPSLVARQCAGQWRRAQWGAADCATVTAITVEGGPGPNVIDASGVLTDDFTSLTTITLHGGGGNDLITGTQTVDTLVGDAGNDHLAGGKGKDQRTVGLAPTN